MLTGCRRRTVLVSVVGPPAVITALSVGLWMASNGTEGWWTDLFSGLYFVALAVGFAFLAYGCRLWERPLRGLAVAAVYFPVTYFLMMGGVIYLGTIILDLLGWPPLF